MIACPPYQLVLTTTDISPQGGENIDKTGREANFIFSILSIIVSGAAQHCHSATGGEGWGIAEVQLLSGETCYAQFLSYLLLFPPGPGRRGGGRDWDKDRVTHPG